MINFHQGNPVHFLDDVRECIVSLMKATSSASSSEDIPVAYNRYPRLSPEMRYVILSAALETRKHEKEEMETQQAHALLELEDLLCSASNVPTTPVQVHVPDSASTDLIDLHSNTVA